MPEVIALQSIQHIVALHGLAFPQTDPSGGFSSVFTFDQSPLSLSLTLYLCSPMPYYSHVLRYPPTKPFDRHELRFSSFVGRFVRPLAALKLHDRFWFTDYGTFARFRVLTERYSEFEPHLISLRDQLGLVDTGEEKGDTLDGSLGHSRFLPPTRQDVTPTQRASAILDFLHFTCILYLQCLIELPDGYWAAEQNIHQENPRHSTFESIHHLFCNITHVPLEVYVAFHTDWMTQPAVGKIPIQF